LPPRSRSDFEEYKRQFRLPPDLHLSDFALLGKTEAKLPSDGFSVVDPLDPDTDQCDLMLEVAGYRYYAENVQVALDEPVSIQAEPGNKFDPDAVMVCTGGKKIGQHQPASGQDFPALAFGASSLRRYRALEWPV